jgi:hypothetical protein
LAHRRWGRRQHHVVVLRPVARTGAHLADQAPPAFPVRLLGFDNIGITLLVLYVFSVTLGSLGADVPDHLGNH